MSVYKDAQLAFCNAAFPPPQFLFLLSPVFAMHRVSHPLSDGMFAVSKGDRTLNNLLPVLGPPQMPMDFNVEDFQSQERWSVEKLYEGKNVYLENMISTMVKRTFNPFVTEYILPLRQYADINFVWQKWNANRTLAPQTAVGAPPERVTQTRSMERATMNRYELGFVVNAETLDNPEGQFALALDIVNVGMAIGDTFEQLGLSALLQRKNYWRERLRKSHVPYGNIADLFGWEKLLWDILRKDPSGRGFFQLNEEVKKANREYIFTDVILAEGVKSLLSQGAGNQDYYIYGSGARNNVENGSDAVGRTVAGGVRAHIVREITIDHDGMRIRPMHRIRTIGDFACIDPKLTFKPEEYTSSFFTVKVGGAALWGSCRSPKPPCLSAVFYSNLPLIFFTLTPCAVLITWYTGRRPVSQGVWGSAAPPDYGHFRDSRRFQAHWVWRID